jgi:hypothetical protein
MIRVGDTVMVLRYKGASFDPVPFDRKLGEVILIRPKNRDKRDHLRRIVVDLVEDVTTSSTGITTSSTRRHIFRYDEIKKISKDEVETMRVLEC